MKSLSPFLCSPSLAVTNRLKPRHLGLGDGMGRSGTVPNFLYYKHQWELWGWGGGPLRNSPATWLHVCQPQAVHHSSAVFKDTSEKHTFKCTSSSRALHPSFGHYSLICWRVCWDKDGHPAVAAALPFCCLYPSLSFISANPRRWHLAALCFLYTNHREKKVYSISGCVTIRKLSTGEKIATFLPYT